MFYCKYFTVNKSIKCVCCAWKAPNFPRIQWLGKIAVGFGRGFIQGDLPFWQAASPTAPPPIVSELLSGDTGMEPESELWCSR